MKTNSIRFLAVLLTGIGTHLKAAEQVTNPVSVHPIIVDGLFTGGISAGQVLGEWSDVTPLAFISPNDPGGALQSVPLSDPSKNSLLYAAVAPGSVGPTELYLMYDYLPRTVPFSAPGEFVADIEFPVTFGGTKFPDSVVSIRTGAGPGVYEVVVDLLGNGSDLRDPDDLGIEVAVGFGPSTLPGGPHMLIELEAPLLIPPGFGNPPGLPFPPDGLPGGIYSPDPAFWGGFEANDDLDPPATAAILTIQPDGSTLVVGVSTEAVPESSTFGAAALLGVGLVLNFYRRRNR